MLDRAKSKVKKSEMVLEEADEEALEEDLEDLAEAETESEDPLVGMCIRVNSLDYAARQIEDFACQLEVSIIASTMFVQLRSSAVIGSSWTSSWRVSARNQQTTICRFVRCC